MNFTYTNLTTRTRLLREAHDRGETLIHDNRINETTNELIFGIRNAIVSPESILLRLLLGKLQNNTITFEQLKTLIRIEHGFELTQTTRDKLLIAVQGVIGSLVDRIKRAFNL